ncbi:DUF4238 domain-containing protein [Planctomycetota bacterium]
MARKSTKQKIIEKLRKQNRKRRGLAPAKFPSRHHYVPIWYQKRFLAEDAKQYYCQRIIKSKVLDSNGTPFSESKVHPVAPVNCFLEKRLYTINLFGVRDEEIEQRLFNSIDNAGGKSLDTVVEEEGWCQEGGIDRWHQFMDIMGAQKLRTPKGLDWIRSLLKIRAESAVYFTENRNIVLENMTYMLQMFSTIWTESEWEILSANNADIGFIISDHPVTAYNHQCPPKSTYCNYPLDPPISLIGTRTIYPLDKKHCLVLTNRQYAYDPDKVDPLNERINARYFDKAIFSFTDVIRERELSDTEVHMINYVTKARARECIAGGVKEWLFPEKHLSGLEWKDIDALLQIPQINVKRTTSLFFSYRDGTTVGYDAFGRKITSKEGLDDHRKSVRLTKRLLRKDRFGTEVSNILNAVEVPNITDQNNMLLDASEQIFGISNENDLVELRNGIPEEKIRTFYSVIEDLWPAGTDTLSNLPKADGSFSIIYSGLFDLDALLCNLLSFGIYADKILICNPFPNPCCLQDEKKPTLHPSIYQVVTYRLLYLLHMYLKPWIRAGLIQIIPNPMSIDFAFRELAVKHAEKRREEYESFDADVGYLESQYQRNMFWRTPNNHIIRRIKELHKDIKEDEIKEILSHIERMKASDASEYLPSIDKTGPQLLVESFGLNLETLLYVSQLTGSIPFTHLNVRDWEINLAANKREESDSLWTDLSEYISSKSIKIMSFAHGDWIADLQSKGNMRSYREFMRTLAAASTDRASYSPAQLKSDFDIMYSDTMGKWNEIEDIYVSIIGKQQYKKGPKLFNDSKIKVGLHGYQLDYVTKHLKDTYGSKSNIDPVPMALYLEPPFKC